MFPPQLYGRTVRLIAAGGVLAAVISAAGAPPAAAQVEREPVAMVTLTAPSRADLQTVARLGIEIHRGLLVRDAVLFVTRRELEALRASGLAPEVVHDDAAAYFASRLDASLGPGSMGGFYTLDEALARMDELAAAYPAIISPRFSVGTSVEGRSIWAFRMSDAPGTIDPGRPAVFYNGLIHAREPIGMMLLLAFAEDLARKYEEGEPSVRYLLSSRELWFMPVINPDGYYYNEMTDPNGGGMWRKNKADNNLNGMFDSSVDGVDLNRNFDFHWGEDDEGSSPNPSSTTYRGPEPFSEPETRAVRDVVLSRPFQFILNYHSFSHVYIYPWGYTGASVDRLVDFRAWAGRMSKFNHFPYGTGTDMIGYPTNGDAADWEYGAFEVQQIVPEKVLAMVPEVGTYHDSFWPPTLRIPVLVREQIGPNYLTAWMAGGVLIVDDIEIADTQGNNNGYAEPGEIVELYIEWTNVGISQSVTGAVATLEIIGNGASVLQDTVSLGDFSVGESRASVEPFQLQVVTAPLGERLEFALQVEAANGYVRVDTIGVLVGQPYTVFAEDWESGTDGWTLGGGFQLTQLDPFQGTFSISDAIYGWITHSENSLDLTSPINLELYDGAVLRFRSRTTVGPRNMAMVTVGPTPQPRPRGIAPAPLVYYTTGSRAGWEEVEIDLSPYAGSSELWLGWYSGYFYMPSRGWSIDNIRIEAWTSATEPGQAPSGEIYLGPPFPNPSNPTVGQPISMRVDLSQLPGRLTYVTMKVYDTRGRLVATLLEGTLDNKVYESYFQWDGTGDNRRPVSSGIYLIELRARGLQMVRKVIVLR